MIRINKWVAILNIVYWGCDTMFLYIFRVCKDLSISLSLTFLENKNTKPLHILGKLTWETQTYKTTDRLELHYGTQNSNVKGGLEKWKDDTLAFLFILFSLFFFFPLFFFLHAHPKISLARCWSSFCTELSDSSTRSADWETKDSTRCRTFHHKNECMRAVWSAVEILIVFIRRFSTNWRINGKITLFY